ncbi:MAG TPA: hypothetical protein ENL04_02880 [Sulfuricurvum sp.]|nr:hypothetical protein [Sulfuricurvum sp.]
MADMFIRLILIAFAILFTACSRDTAFEYFTRLDSTQERAVTNLKRVTLKEDNRTVALLSVIYLNPVDPALYQQQQHFLVALYDTQKRPLTDYTITLNGKTPAGIVTLDDNCSLRALMPLNNPWNDYYQLVFSATGDHKLTLQFETGPSLQGAVTYDTDR